MECIRLMVRNLDLDRKLLYVRDAKGGKDRTMVFPQSIQSELRMHLEKVKRHHVLESGLQKVYTHVMEKDISAVSSPLDRLLKADS